MSWKSYTTHLLLVVAVLVVGPAVGIVLALPDCNRQKADNAYTDCPYSELAKCDGRPSTLCTGLGHYPQKGYWGDCKSGSNSDYCGYPQDPYWCYQVWTCEWDPVKEKCIVMDFEGVGWWTYPQNYDCNPVA